MTLPPCSSIFSPPPLSLLLLNSVLESPGSAFSARYDPASLFFYYLLLPLVFSLTFSLTGSFKSHPVYRRYLPICIIMYIILHLPYKESSSCFNILIQVSFSYTCMYHYYIVFAQLIVLHVYYIILPNYIYNNLFISQGGYFKQGFKVNNSISIKYFMNTCAYYTSTA